MMKFVMFSLMRWKKSPKITHIRIPLYINIIIDLIIYRHNTTAPLQLPRRRQLNSFIVTQEKYVLIDCGAENGAYQSAVMREAARAAAPWGPSLARISA